MCKENGCCRSGCVVRKVRKILLIVGGLNWGLVGLGMLFNVEESWNIVHMLLGQVPVVEAVVYVLVGLAALMKIFGCQCKKCKEACASCCHAGDMEKKV
ncbi:MAG: DUF378 domain-containing protein [Patescibacteria group bacterium]